MAEQLPLDLGHAPAFAEADFLCVPGNALAFERMAQGWSGFGMALCGPAGSGKSHLAAIFAARQGGVVIPASGLDEEMVPALAERGAVAVEDVDQGGGEVALFHLHNLLRETGGKLLVTGRGEPAHWPVGLADLRSRLAALPVTAIAAPDDDLLNMLLLKLFSDRQLRVGPEVLTYLLPRMERSFDSARALVAAIDAHALARQRPITVPLLRELLTLPDQDPTA